MRPFARTLAALLLLFFTPSFAPAQAAPADDGVVQAAREGAKITLRIIHAKKGQDQLSPELNNISKFLRSSFKDYAFFDLLSTQEQPLKKGEKHAFELPNGNALVLEYRDFQAPFFTIGVQLAELESVVKVRDGGLFFQAGRRHQGGMIVLAIEVNKTP